MPNLTLVVILFFTILLVWIVFFVRDQYQKYKGTRKPTYFEPWMTNFTVRFLYEIFFEICVCLMINSSYLDVKDSA